MENNLEMKNSNDKGEQPQSESVNNDAEKQKGILSVLLKDTGVEKIILCKDASLMNLEVRVTGIIDNIFFFQMSRLRLWMIRAMTDPRGGVGLTRFVGCLQRVTAKMTLTLDRK